MTQGFLRTQGFWGMHGVWRTQAPAHRFLGFAPAGSAARCAGAGGTHRRNVVTHKHNLDLQEGGLHRSGGTNLASRSEREVCGL